MNVKVKKTVDVVARIIVFIESNFHTAGLISCIVANLLVYFDVFKVNVVYSIFLTVGIIFFYICRKLDKIENQVSLNTILLTNKRR